MCLISLSVAKIGKLVYLEKSFADPLQPLKALRENIEIEVKKKTTLTTNRGNFLWSRSQRPIPLIAQ